jgi:hypothetical protein
MGHRHWLGSFICLVLSLILMFCQLGVLDHAYYSLGLGENLFSATSPGTLLAIATWAAAVTFGFFLLEVWGITSLQPWMHGISGLARKALAAFCILGIILAFSSQIVMGFYRTSLSADKGTAGFAVAQAGQVHGEGNSEGPVSIGEQDAQAWLPLAVVLAANASIIGAGLFSMNGSFALMHLLLLWGVSAVAVLPMAAAEFVLLVVMRLTIMADVGRRDDSAP